MISPDDNLARPEREGRLLAVSAAAQTAVDTFNDLWPSVACGAMQKAIRLLEAELKALHATMTATAGR